MKRFIIPLIFSLGLWILLASCTGAPSRPETEDPEDQGTLVYLTDQVGVPLLAPGLVSTSIAEYQALNARWGDRSFFLNALVQLDDQGMYILGLGEMGQQILEVSYTSRGLESQTIAGFGVIDPRYLLMDLQLAFFPPDLLVAHLESAGLRFHVQSQGDTEVRRISQEDMAIMDIAIAPETLSIVNVLRNYEYVIWREQLDD